MKQLIKFTIQQNKLIQVIQYSPDHAVQWDDFVRNHSRNGTLFHEQQFLSYHPEGKFQDASLIFESEGIILGVFPAAIIQNSKVISHPGSSCGGLIFRKECGLREVIEMTDALMRYFQEKEMEEIELRLAEPLFAWPLSDELSFSLWHRGFQLKSKEISTCIPFQENYHWLEWGRKKNIFDIRKAEKEGYQVTLDSDASIAWEIVNRNLDTRYQKTPTHSKEELIQLKELYPERIHPWVCRNAEGEEMACVICFEANSVAIHDFYIAQDYGKVKLNLMPFVFQKILEYYQAQKYHWFNFGISSRGDWIKWGILEFKERIGGRAQTRDTWKHSNLKIYQSIHESEQK